MVNGYEWWVFHPNSTMTHNETLKRLDDEIAKVIDEIEGLQSRLQKDWVKKNKRDKLKEEINEINNKIQKIFEKIIDITGESSEKK